MMVRNQLARDLIANPYAWPGGYPMFAIMDDGGTMCPECVRDTYDIILRSDGNDGWRVVGLMINWEDQDLTCAHCGDRIPSAYGDEYERNAIGDDDE